MNATTPRRTGAPTMWSARLTRADWVVLVILPAALILGGLLGIGGAR